MFEVLDLKIKVKERVNLTEILKRKIEERQTKDRRRTEEKIEQI